MREIKFRAFDNNIKKMTYMDENGVFRNVFIGDIAKELQSCELGLLIRRFYHGRIKLMQYTGINDKNGKYIYEDDVVKDGASKDGRYWKVSISPKYGIKFTLISDIDYVFSYDNFTKFHKDNIEVIGNIHENSEFSE